MSPTYLRPHVQEIRTRVAAGESYRVLAREFGVHRSTIERMVYGQTYPDEPGPIRVPGRYYDRLTEAERAGVWADRRAGLSFPAIARKRGISITTAWRHSPASDSTQDHS